MERLTSVKAPRRGMVLHLVMLALLLAGPSIVAKVVSFTTSVVTWPLTQEIRIADNRFETFNTELLIIYIVGALGLNLLFQTGLLSIGHSALFALGAYTVAITTVDHGWSFWLAFPVAGLLTGLVGFVLSIPSLRLGVFTLAMVTIGYAFVAEDLAIEWKSLTGGGDGLRGIVEPSPFNANPPRVDTGIEFYWLLVIAVVVGYFVAHNLLRSPVGRSSKAIQENPVAAQSLGINPYVVKVRAFTVSSVYAGLAGALYAPLLGFVAPDSFTVNLSITLLLMVLFGGSGTLAGPVIGAILLFRIPLEVERLTDQSGEWSLLVYGIVLLISVHLVPQGLVSAWWWVRDRLLGRAKGDEVRPRDRADVTAVLRDIESDGTPMLAAVGIGKSYGGVRPLDEVDLAVRPGTVHALIGPNGSGKTTFLNTVSGYIAPDQGTLGLLGTDAKGTTPVNRARIGLARTFQTPYVFEGMSCLENVLVALDRHRAKSLWAYVVRWPGARREERAQYDRAVEILGAVGLGGRIADRAGDLPPGERRLLELARVIAIDPRLVLMDEPAAGLTSGEIEELEEVINGLRQSGIGVVLVEHHVDMVMRLADEITVIDFGRVIAHGPPSEIRDNPAVIAAYLGEGEGEDVIDAAIEEVALEGASHGEDTSA
ncbi:MAG: ATP-binding cassette domain-containing protein [Acidimicrobiia bacterium]